MRLLYLLTLIYIGFTLASCSTIEQPANKQTHPSVKTPPLTPPTCPEMRKKKNPLSVSLFIKKPDVAYKVLGEEKVAKYNSSGNKRQEASLRYALRETAAQMGGDAVINLKNTDHEIKGTVIAFGSNSLAENA